MPKVRTRLKTNRPESTFDRGLEEELLRFMGELSGILNGGVTFADNFNAQIITISDTGVADAQNTVTHTLQRVPIGFIVLNRNKGGVMYDAGTAWTTTNLYLKCTTANTTVKLLVF